MGEARSGAGLSPADSGMGHCGGWNAQTISIAAARRKGMLNNLRGRRAAPKRRQRLEPEPATPRTPETVNGDLKKPDLQELEAILEALPQKTLNIRGAGYGSRNIRIPAEANPHLFAYEKETWPKVKYPE